MIFVIAAKWVVDQGSMGPYWLTDAYKIISLLMAELCVLYAVAGGKVNSKSLDVEEGKGK